MAPFTDNFFPVFIADLTCLQPLRSQGKLGSIHLHLQPARAGVLEDGSAQGNKEGNAPPAGAEEQRQSRY